MLILKWNLINFHQNCQSWLNAHFDSECNVNQKLYKWTVNIMICALKHLFCICILNSLEWNRLICHVKTVENLSTEYLVYFSNWIIFNGFDQRENRKRERKKTYSSTTKFKIIVQNSIWRYSSYNIDEYRTKTIKVYFEMNGNPWLIWHFKQLFVSSTFIQLYEHKYLRKMNNAHIYMYTAQSHQ